MDLIGKGNSPSAGMSANADMTTRTELNVISVPINAVTTRDKNEEERKTKKAMTSIVINRSKAPI